VSYLPVIPDFGRRGAVDTTHVTTPNGVAWQAQRMSWRAIGGPHRANIRASRVGIDYLADMLDYLRNGVKLYDQQNELCWWGYVHEVKVRWGMTEVGVSLDRMFNRILVRYKALTPGEDSTEDAETDWAEDAASTTEYGDKEAVLSSGSLVLSADAADTLRDIKLAELSRPSAVADYEGLMSDPVVDILCLGWWHTLGWVYYSQAAGRISYTEGDGAIQGIGQAAYTTGVTVTWADISEGDFMYDTAASFGRYSEGQIITVTGAANAANNKSYGILDINPALTTLTLDSDAATDAAADSITITPQGTKGAQHFQTGPNDDWTVVSIRIRAKTVGNPSGSLRVSIYSDDGAGNPNASLASGTLATADLDGVMRWRTFTLTSTLTLSALTEYHIVIDRTAADAAADAYHVELSTDAGAGNVYQYWDGAAWTPRASVDMTYEIVGGYLASQMIKQVLETSAFVTEVTVINDSRDYTPLTQIEYQTVKTVVEGLLDIGTSNDLRLQAKMDEHRAVTIKEEPSVSNSAARYTRDRNGVLRDYYGAAVEPQRAGEIAGNWLVSDDIDAIATEGSDLADAARAFVDEVEWSAADNSVRFTARGAKNVWESDRRSERSWVGLWQRLE
jgi:hypothetical protein